MQKLDISAITGRKSGAGYARRLQAIALTNQALPDLMYLVTGATIHASRAVALCEACSEQGSSL